MDDMINQLQNKGISPEKLAMLMEFVGKSKNKSPQDYLPFFMMAAQKASSSGMDFNDDETNLILETMMPNMTAEDKRKIASMRNLANIIARKSNRGKN
ncbi:MAG: hypothetical protein E7269_05795 [Lachnospiraceae bacterium]|nr:hypothetical protein [Lachnospiraceae bacterium]